MQACGEAMSGQSVQVQGGRLAMATPDVRGVRCFKGIPYAAPPVGPLRWRPPAPVPSWNGVRPTDAFGANAMQGVVFSDIDLYADPSSSLKVSTWTAEASPSFFTRRASRGSEYSWSVSPDVGGRTRIEHPGHKSAPSAER